MSLLPSSSLVKQLANRLETSNVAERISALQELQTIARSMPHVVGELALQQVLHCLREQGDTEEYQEALDLLYRLIKTKDSVAAFQNTNLFLNEISNIEILLDLLEHDDLTVGVMSSQILTEIHANNGIKLEKQIHDCPNGMNKLLLRLPDTSREEVRNQSLVLVQQLTLKNEEMKKTVVFNDGFSIIFGIIVCEGGSSDGGVVVQDCLKICKNLLTESETCQRFFYGMGSEWIMNLNEFFDPIMLENLSVKGSLDDSGLEITDMVWFDQPGRVSCAALSLKAISSSLSIPNNKHQSVVGISISGLIPAAAFWIARKGPSAIVNASLSLLDKVVDGNKSVGEHLADVLIKITNSLPGKNIPIGCEPGSLQFGWKPLSNDERKYITLLSLLVERYIYSCESWNSTVIHEDNDSNDVKFDTSINDGLSQGCITVLEKILSAYPTINDLTIQHVLAPPPPSDETSEMESIRPLGTLVLNILVESCFKIIDRMGNNISLQGNVHKTDIEIAERAANIFALFFIYGGQLSRELSTVINTSHVVNNDRRDGQAISNQPLLPFLLATTGRAARAISNVGSSHSLVVALLRMLATAVSGCEIAAKLVLSDPSNLFVVDLATVASENAGIPSNVQVVACLFLGMCFLALPSSDENTSDQDDRLTRRSFVSMIDSKIGLTRFTDILKRPILTMTSSNKIFGINNLGTGSDIFFTKGFKIFYEAQIESIRSGIFDFYAGGDNSTAIDSAHLQVIEMQKEKILELESQIKLLQSNQISNNQIITSASDSSNQLQENDTKLQEKIDELTKTNEQQKSQIENFIKIETTLSIENETLQTALKTTEQTLNELQMKYLRQSDGSNDEVVGLKQSILQLDTERNQLKDIVKQRDRKIQLLEGELKGPIPSEMAREKKITDLEARNAELKQQLWQAEANANSLPQSKEPIEWKILYNSFKQMTTKLGMHEDDNVFSIDDSTMSPSEIISKIDAAFRFCTEGVVFAIGNCSDIAEAVGINNLDGDEGSIVRLKDCVEKVANRLAEREEEIEEIKSKNVILLRERDQLEIEKKSFENDLNSNKEVERLNKITNDQKELLKTVQSENDILMAQFNESAVRFNEEIRILMEKEHHLVSLNDEKDAEIVRLKKITNSNTLSQEPLSSSNDSDQQKNAEIVKLTQLIETIKKTSKEVTREKDEEINKLKKRLESKDSDHFNENIKDLSGELQNAKDEVLALTNKLDFMTENYNSAKSEIEVLKNEIDVLKNEIDHLKQEHSNAMSYSANVPQHIQDQEQQLLRITSEATRLAQVLQEKDIENQRLHVLIQKKEGELAGVMSSFQALQVETDSLSNELNDINNANKCKDTEIGELKSSNDSLSYLLQLEMSQTEQLKNSIEKLEHSYNNNVNKIYVTADIIELIRSMISLLSHDTENKDDIIDDSDLYSLTYKLKVLIEGIDQNSLPSKTILQTPAKGKNNSIFTPLSGTEKSGRYFANSPAAKEMSRLYADINIERRRLFILQEQHSDLLGLLAQQEVELSVFKDILEQEAGNKAVQHAEEESKKVNIEKYGYYTDFRNYTVEEDLEVDSNHDINLTPRKDV